MGFQFELKLAAVLAVLQGISVGATYIVSQGDLNGDSRLDDDIHRHNSRTKLLQRKIECAHTHDLNRLHVN
jgi:hypothetical protein